MSNTDIRSNIDIEQLCAQSDTQAESLYEIMLPRNRAKKIPSIQDCSHIDGIPILYSLLLDIQRIAIIIKCDRIACTKLI